jgi:hypothetical protein
MYYQNMYANLRYRGGADLEKIGRFNSPQAEFWLLQGQNSACRGNIGAVNTPMTFILTAGSSLVLFFLILFNYPYFGNFTGFRLRLVLALLSAPKRQKLLLCGHAQSNTALCCPRSAAAVVCTSVSASGTAPTGPSSCSASASLGTWFSPCHLCWEMRTQFWSIVRHHRGPQAILQLTFLPCVPCPSRSTLHLSLSAVCQHPRMHAANRAVPLLFPPPPAPQVLSHAMTMRFRQEWPVCLRVSRKRSQSETTNNATKHGIRTLPAPIEEFRNAMRAQVAS